MQQDSFNLQRFLKAQDQVICQVLAELQHGRKKTHWMWFIFPQLAGLGRSSISQKYAISGEQEAREYLKHDILGPRLRECTNLVNNVNGRSIEDILRYPDDLKFHSSMTLFAHVSDQDRDFTIAIEKYFDGAYDAATLRLLGAKAQEKRV